MKNFEVSYQENFEATVEGAQAHAEVSADLVFFECSGSLLPEDVKAVANMLIKAAERAEELGKAEAGADAMNKQNESKQ